MKNQQLTIIAGPCSIDENNLHEIFEISEIKVDGKHAIEGTRVVGLKSRTELNISGNGMGIDFEVTKKNIEMIKNWGNVKDLITPPSVTFAKEIFEKTNMLIATEIMVPYIQMPVLEGIIPEGKLLVWNPAVNQLGWPLFEMANYAKDNGWIVGIKNPKWLGEGSMAKTWQGSLSYVNGAHSVLIHRGVDVGKKKNYRNKPVHEVAKLVKASAGKKLLFDPSHIFGSKLKSKIVKETIKAMKMKLTDDEFLYDGILIEVGTSQTDPEQHISIDELKILVKKLSKFRTLATNR
jgi:3-deoxy-D-arabino-heptulosonate 7-phosphate (DAHP) synthase